MPCCLFNEKFREMLWQLGKMRAKFKEENWLWREYCILNGTLYNIEDYEYIQWYMKF